VADQEHFSVLIKLGLSHQFLLTIPRHSLNHQLSLYATKKVKMTSHQVVSEGLFGKIMDTVNTAKDIVQAIMAWMR
jgi:hypothetical protein